MDMQTYMPILCATSASWAFSMDWLNGASVLVKKAKSTMGTSGKTRVPVKQADGAFVEGSGKLVLLWPFLATQRVSSRYLILVYVTHSVL